MTSKETNTGEREVPKSKVLWRPELGNVSDALVNVSGVDAITFLVEANNDEGFETERVIPECYARTNNADGNLIGYRIYGQSLTNGSVELVINLEDTEKCQVAYLDQ